MCDKDGEKTERIETLDEAQMIQRMVEQKDNAGDVRVVVDS